MGVWTVALGVLLAALQTGHSQGQGGRPSRLSPNTLLLGKARSNPCANDLKTCGECIRASSVCAWCSSSNWTRSQSRCDLYEHLKHVCVSKHLTYPISKTVIMKNDNVRGGDGEKQPIQVQPQALDVLARTNEPISFKLSFRQAENYPVDLYFLLDLSITMIRKKAREKLISLGQEMPVSMENITKDFNLGFGTFVDKDTMPFTAWTDKLLEDRCPLEGKNCFPPHDFINQLNLGKEGKVFSERMAEALKAVSQSFDDSEGGMDGVIQALACEKQVGWRERSRRILVYSSNSIFHLAGDGVFGGATKNNDGLCHLNNQGSYDPSDKEYDFPSVAQIASLLEEKSASIIFAVMPNVTQYYDRLRDLLGSAVEIGELEDQSSNIIQLIRKNYDKLRSRIHFLPRNADGIEFKLKSSCLGGALEERFMCEGLEIKDSVTFEVDMTVSSEVCAGQQGVVQRSVELAAQGLNERLAINLSIICDCQCERPGYEDVNSAKCTNGNGTLECGICSCNPDRHGRLCECSTEEISNEKSLEDCRRGNETVVCSGHGDCICGQCVCFNLHEGTQYKYAGEHCECDNYNCGRADNGKLCGGETRGRCSCGQCECLDGWKGDTCDCSTDNSTCYAANGKECNGKGYCECGRCQCNVLDYMGPTCEECPECPSKCIQFLDCAQCRGFQSGKYSQAECEQVCPEVEMRDTLETDNVLVRKCDYTDNSDGCLFHFTYEYDDKSDVVIKVQKTKECPEELNLAVILGPVVAAVVLIPLLLICIFILLRNRKDRAEFARFMKEKDKAKWDSGSNPIYKDPKSTFKNPTYKGGN